MPELPDLQVFSRNLNKLIAGKKVKEVQVHNSKKLNVPAKELAETLQQQTLKEVYREGKELFFKFSKGDVLALHLMLNGKLNFSEGRQEQKYTILELLFTDDTALALTDFQGQAAPSLNPEQKEAPDALSETITPGFLKEQLQKKRTSIKGLLLDQHIIRGIGNAYADEILWHARISPLSVSNKIPENKVSDLAEAIKKVLHDAEKQILKSHPDIISGEVRGFLDIHNSRKKKSPGGADIQTTQVNSRKTYFTSEQELFN